ncbi:hypothetical protein Trydic_g459, partial [Trypoxylus dichotomus]
VNKKTVRSWFH